MNTQLTINTRNYGVLPAHQCPICNEIGIHPDHLGDIAGAGWVTVTDIHGQEHICCELCVQNGNDYEHFEMPEDDE